MPQLIRITRDPAVMSGKPCIRGMRITVGTVVGLVAAGRTRDEILRGYLTYIGSQTNSAVATDTFVRKHFADHKDQLLKIVEIGDGELYQLSIQKTLNRWEGAGPTDLADWILQHGLTKDGKLAITPAALPKAAPHTRQVSIAWLQKWQKTKMAMLKK